MSKMLHTAKTFAVSEDLSLDSKIEKRPTHSTFVCYTHTDEEEKAEECSPIAKGKFPVLNDRT